MIPLIAYLLTVSLSLPSQSVCEPLVTRVLGLIFISIVVFDKNDTPLLEKNNNLKMVTFLPLILPMTVACH